MSQMPNRGMDSATYRHLRAWLYGQVSDDDARDVIAARMLDMWAEDTEYWEEHGWARLFDRVDGWAINERMTA